MCQDVHPVECKPAKLKNAGTGGSESSASTASKISSGQSLPPTAPSSVEIPPGRDLVRGDSGEIWAPRVGSGSLVVVAAPAARARSAPPTRVAIPAAIVPHFEEHSQACRLEVLLKWWTHRVNGWLHGAPTHPGRGFRDLSAAERESVQREQDFLCGNPFEVALRGVHVNGLCTARGTQRAVLEMLGRACHEGIWIIILLGFTFDRDDIADSLIDAAKKGSAVTGVFDKKNTFYGQTTHMPETLAKMAAQGVAVRVLEGDVSTSEYEAVGRSIVGFKGLQHAKGFLMYRREEAYAVLGSCNWTTASRVNSELGIVVRAKAEGAFDLLRWFGTAVLRSGDYKDAAQAARLRKVSSAAGRSSSTGR